MTQLNLVKLSSSYARSTNIELDYKDTSKLRSIYLTSKFEQGILESLNSALDENSNHRVRVISGSPGLGKSTFALLLSNLLSKNNPRVLTSLINASSGQNSSELKKIYKSFQSSKRSKLLPVFLNGYMGELEDVFVSNLQDAMGSVGLENEFKEILRASGRNQVNIINKWRKSYPEIYNNFQKALKKESYKDSKDFVRDISCGKSVAREIFFRVYSEVTGGASLSIENDVIKVYKKSIKLLQKHGYAGVFVVYDEFGKYLERGVHNPTTLNVQLLQDFAEFCDRSGKNQCHLYLITHLSVSQYASKLPVSVQQEWAKIEGRFQESSFYDRSSNHYKMISRVFEKNINETSPPLHSKWKKYLRDFKKRFEQKSEGLSDLLGLNDFMEIAERCYPLHPLTLAFLPRLSQRVAQNERTLYTFLTRDEDSSLKRFLSKGTSSDELNVLRPTHLYEYFSPLIAKDTGVGGSYKIQLIVEEAKNKIDLNDEISREIISLIALVSVVRDFTFASPDQDFICSALACDYSPEKVKSRLSDLVNKKVLFFNKIHKNYELHEGSSVDIDEEISRLRNIKLTSKDLVRIVKAFSQPDFVVPKRYNLKHSITRFYRADIISVEDLKKLNAQHTPDYYREDGLVYYVLPFSNDELAEAREIVQNSQRELCVFVLPRTFTECRSDIEELNAINSLYNNKEVINSGPLVKKELDRYRVVQTESLKNILRNLIGTETIEVEVHYPLTQVEQSVRHFSSLQRVLGDIFEATYSDTIDFNLEYLNKHKISGNIALARKNFIDLIFTLQKSGELKFKGNGPEVAILKALKKISGLRYDTDKRKVVVNKKSQLSQFSKKYKKLISSANGVRGDELLTKLVAPPFGLRKGFVPVVLALSDLLLEQPVNHYFDDRFVTALDGDHYDLLIKHPKNCVIHYHEISTEQLSFLNQLCEIFDVSSRGEIRPLVEGIFSWRCKIPASSKHSKDLSKPEKKFLIHLDNAKEPEKLIFCDIPEALNFSPISSLKKKEVEEVAHQVKTAKESIFNIYPDLISSIHSLLIDNLQFIQSKCLNERPIDYSKGMNLARVYQETFNRLEPKVLNHPFNKVTASFLGRVRGFDSSNHPQYFVETVADALTGSNPRFWDHEGLSLFEYALTSVQNEIEMVNEYLSSQFNGESALAFIKHENSETEYIRLGVQSGLSEKLKSRVPVLEEALSDLTEKEKTDLLVTFLRNRGGSTRLTVSEQEEARF